VFCEAVEWSGAAITWDASVLIWSEPRSHIHDECRCYCRSELCTRMV